ncbi:hypothetical protein BDR26DRAFT_856474 [Obelidium mucronatum]|nr:hypothetical protein BDR26DRAFT_856474 [Obelidium mucronatum]
MNGKRTPTPPSSLKGLRGFLTKLTKGEASGAASPGGSVSGTAGTTGSAGALGAAERASLDSRASTGTGTGSFSLSSLNTTTTTNSNNNNSSINTAESRFSSLQSDLRNIQRDLEGIALEQHRHNASLHTPALQQQQQQQQPATPPLSPKLHPKSIRSMQSTDASPRMKGGSRKTHSSLDITPDTTDQSTISSETKSLKSTRSLQSVDSRTEHEYLMLLEEQGRNVLPIRSGLGITSNESLYSPASSLDRLHSNRPQSSAHSSSSISNQIHVSQKLLEETEKAILRLDLDELGEGYPDTSSLMLNEGGRLLLPSERKKLMNSSLNSLPKV